jgi:hypothetical protein
MTKGYVTKYALTQGILVIEGEFEEVNGTAYFTETPEKIGQGMFLALDKDVFLTLEDALNDCRVRAEKNVAAKKAAFKKAEDLWEKYCVWGSIPIDESRLKKED